LFQEKENPNHSKTGVKKTWKKTKGNAENNERHWEGMTKFSRAQHKV